MIDPRVPGLLGLLHAGRLSRRSFVGRAGSVGLAGFAAALRTSGATASAPSLTAIGAARLQIDAKTLVIADAMTAAPWITLDPAVFYEINPSAAMNMVFETLYHAPDGTKPDQFEPLLAADMPEVANDGKEVTIRLRPGIKFHTTGNEMTADDWIFSWNRLANKKGNGAFLATNYWSKVEKVDPLTLKLTFERGVAPLLPILSSMPLSVTDSAALRQNGGTDAPDADQTDKGQAWFDAGNSGGTGPFKLTAFDISTEVVIERNPDYWGEAPSLDRIIWRNIESPTEQVQAVQSGEADVAYSVDPDAAESVRNDPDLQLITGPTLAIEYLALQTKPDPGGPLAKKELRQAIGYAIDYDGIINSLLAGAAESPGPATIVPLPLLSTKEAQAFAYKTDLAKAQELFDAAGVGPVELTFSYGSGESGQGGLSLETLATKLQSDLQQIDGLTIKLNPMDSDTRLADYRAGKLQFTVSGWTPDFVDVDTYAVPFAHSGSTGTAARRVGYGTPEIDQLLDAGLYELDVAKRTELYLEVQKHLIEDAPFLVLYQPKDQKPARKAVQGVETHPVYQIQLRRASKTE